MDVSIPTGQNISESTLSNANGWIATPATSLPRTTTSRSSEYRHRLAEITSRATVNDPLNILFQQEKTGRSVQVTPELLYKAGKGRVEAKVAAGAVVVEAADFAAVACWEPPAAVPHPLTEVQLQELAVERPVFAHFARDLLAAKSEYLGAEQPCWVLSLMARDPDRKDKGAVRAVIEPYVARAREEGLPLWLVAGNSRARDVYGYLGFRVVKTIYSSAKDRTEDDGQGAVPTYCMVCNWPPDPRGLTKSI